LSGFSANWCVFSAALKGPGPSTAAGNVRNNDPSLIQPIA
jgi:hypothetical protein